MSTLARLLTDRRVVGVCQVLIALAFLTAGLAKIGDAATFARQIHHFRLLPFGLENLLAITLPWVEVVAAMAILLRLQPRAGSAIGAGLMAIFLLAVAVAMVRRLDISCGCFGTLDATRVGAGKLLENVGLLAVALVACLPPRPHGRAVSGERGAAGQAGLP